MLPPLQILLVDDNLINQTVAARLLEKAGHRVTVAGNGAAAVAEVDRQAFDVVLMDVQMPEMDGFQATEAIRRRERPTDRRLPIIALTANALAGYREQCLGAGMDGYVTKPFQIPVLFREIAAAMKLVPQST
ncbi:MAG: response regulator [Gemmataceae bacterium]